MYSLSCPMVAAAISFSIFGVGLLFVGWSFRRVEPDRWRAMSAYRARNGLLGLTAAIGPVALCCLGPDPVGMRSAIWFIAIPPLIGAAVMCIFFGRLNHAKAAGGPVDPET